PDAYIREFNTLEDQLPPVPFERIQDIIRQELGKELDRVFVEFDKEPTECRLMFQSHNARLPDFTPVTVKISRTALSEDFLVDRELLSNAGETLRALGLNQAQIQSVVSDFQRTLDHQLNLRYHADALDRLYEDAQANERLAGPMFYRDVSTARML